MNFVQSHPEVHVYFFYIQKAPESFAKVLGEKKKNPNKTVYVSGSNKQTPSYWCSSVFSFCILHVLHRIRTYTHTYMSKLKFEFCGPFQY